MDIFHTFACLFLALMSDVAIKIENLSKQYRLGVVGTGTLSHDLKRWWTVNMRGKEDPYLKIGETNDRSTKGNSEYVWALKDINLEIKKGDVVGIIGKNGAGKSTLLKILSKVTKPTTGTIQYKGRIASLLEVGTGFHMEMTGRENIYMNGAIMGMTRAEITRKLDEIIDFAGVERFIDTPVKRYSSGMTVRLGFAIAAHLEPEILIIDEVLAVGDAEFQKKAIGKMQDVSQSEGRTVLFVSHNMAAIESLCNRSILMQNGGIFTQGDTKNVITEYLTNNFDEIFLNDWEASGTIPGNQYVSLLKAYLKINDSSSIIQTNTPFSVVIDFINNQTEQISINLICRLFSNEVIFEFPMEYQNFKLGKNSIEFYFPSFFLNSNMYTIQVNFSTVGPRIFFYKEKIIIFEIHNKAISQGFYQKTAGLIFPKIEYVIS